MDLYEDLLSKVRERISEVEAERARMREADEALRNELYRLNRVTRAAQVSATDPKVRDAKRKRDARNGKGPGANIEPKAALRHLDKVFARYGDGTHFTIRMVATNKYEVNRLQKAIAWGREQGYIRLLGREGGKRGGGGNLFQVVHVPEPVETGPSR